MRYLIFALCGMLASVSSAQDIVYCNSNLLSVPGPHMGPAAVKVGNKTYFVFQGTDHDPMIAEYAHVTGQWSDKYLVGINPLTNDAHGSPVLHVDAQGYIHVYGACHGSPLKHWRSDAAHDITAFTELADVVQAAQYPTVIDRTNNEFLFYREGGGHNQPIMYRVSTDDGQTFSPATILMDQQDESWYYTANKDKSSDKIHFATIWHDHFNQTGSPLQHGARRFNVYHAVYDGQWKNATGEVLILPIDKDQADDKMLIFDSGTDTCTALALETDLSGNVACLINSGSGVVFTYWFGIFDGSWTFTPIATTDHFFDKGSLRWDTGQWQAVLEVGGTSGTVGDGDNFTDRGGYANHYRSTDNGLTWSLESTLEGHRIIQGIQAVKNGVPEVAFVAGEWHNFDLGLSGLFTKSLAVPDPRAASILAGK